MSRLDLGAERSTVIAMLGLFIALVATLELAIDCADTNTGGAFMLTCGFGFT